MSIGTTKICFPFVGNDIGGSHISAVKLIQNLDRNEFECLIVLHTDQGELAPYLSERGLSWETIPDAALLRPNTKLRNLAKVLQSWAHFPSTLLKLRKFLRDNRIDIVHTNDGMIHVSWAIASRLSGVRHLWHHRADPRAKGVNFAAPVLADHIVTVSNFARPCRPLFPVTHKTSVIHSPFDHPSITSDKHQIRQKLAMELGCAPTTRFLGFFGSLVERKRPMKFVEVLHEFRRRHPHIEVAGLIFGAPPINDAHVKKSHKNIEDLLRQRANALGIANEIHLMGFRQPVEPYIQAIDILLVPAVNEPFGRTLIEAMLLGTPVIAANHGGNPEAIKDGINGYLVEPDNPVAFVDPILQLLNDDAVYRQISETAREQAKNHYGIAPHVNKMSGIYKQLKNASKRFAGEENRFPRTETGS